MKSEKEQRSARKKNEKTEKKKVDVEQVGFAMKLSLSMSIGVTPYSSVTLWVTTLLDTTRH